MLIFIVSIVRQVIPRDINHSNDIEKNSNPIKLNQIDSVKQKINLQTNILKLKTEMSFLNIPSMEDNPQKQLKPSKQQYFKQNSLKGSVVGSVYQSSQSIEQLLQYFKNYQCNEEYIDVKKLHTSQHLKLKKYKESVYYGDFVNGKRHGQGIMVYNQGLPLVVNRDNFPVQRSNIQVEEIKFRIYQGQWENDYKHGKGMEKFANGTLYQGFYVNGKPQGVGRYAWPNGQFYEGEWLNGMKHGSGMWKGAKGDSYVGEWKFGKADGYGVHTWINGDRYEGEFKDCLKNGQGLQKFSNGDIYKGLYSMGKPSGFGQYYWTNGSYFKGAFKNGLRSGHGIWKKGHGNSDKYEGEYLNDKKSGYGIFTWASGNVYKGNYDTDSRNGYGEMYWVDGSFYKGDWWNGIQHGKGEIYIPGDGVKKGQFQNNTLVSVEQQSKNDSQMPRNQLLLQSKEYSQKSQYSSQLKTKQTFRSRAHSNNSKKPTPNSKEGQVRVFKLVELKDNLYNSVNKNNTKRVTPSRDESFQSTLSINEKRGFIRFGQGNQSKERKSEGSKSIESRDKKERIMHSAFYMHKYHNQLQRNSQGVKTAQFDRTLQY